MLLEFEPTGDWGKDCALGHKLAEAVLKEMREKRTPLLLGDYVSQMVQSNRYSGIEVGFCHVIAQRAMLAK